ncbi:hypothetical protein PHMEG_00011526 [Phytophthora megakarya]|uniref:Uncharacterized protein n=1 Tax=Phytophthora megakarya TaxID=4795 RepID=A0A225WBG8_9STRA|nr:hypothetical protein PHMEG_00011526 [Phytophthora megakarya]
MDPILGVEGINDEKFTPWATRQRVLGLEFDSTAVLVRMTKAKIDKPRRIIAAAYDVTVLTRKAYNSLLGSLRHVSTVTVSGEMKQDLLRWWQVFHQPQLNGVSLEYINALPLPDIIIEVDASAFGLCALDITAEHALTYLLRLI